MLWSNPRDEPPKDLRDAQTMLRRLGLVVALCTVLVLLTVC